MIRLRSIGLSRGGNPLLSSADAVIAPGERVALIGPNGSGKSSLLSALMGDVLLDSGQIELPPIRIACLEQTVPGTAMAAWRFVEAADTNLLRARVAADAARHSGDGHAIAISQQDLLDAGDASSHARVKELLAGLGFSETMSEQA
ncbi:MAG: ATP-binding cassette domain-containing protein, partial [Quisquiliibacterium sp.]